MDFLHATEGFVVGTSFLLLFEVFAAFFATSTFFLLCPLPRPPVRVLFLFFASSSSFFLLLLFASFLLFPPSPNRNQRI